MGKEGTVSAIQVVQETFQLSESMMENHKCVIHVRKSAEEHADSSNGGFELSEQHAPQHSVC
jgi:hypothetical protein